MAQHLDLQEQEQLDQLKHFWKQHGNWISWALIVILIGIAGWNGHQYWQRNQALQAAGLFDEADRAARGADLARLEQAFADMKSKFPGTVLAQQTGLLLARAHADQGKVDQAKAPLQWVAEQSNDEGYQAIARLRLAALFADAKAYDQALGQLDAVKPVEFQPLVADRRGDILLLQGHPAKAKEAYAQAHRGLQDSRDYQRLVEVKLNALGVDPTAGTASAAGQAKP